MSTQQLMDALYQNHKGLADYVNGLSDEKFMRTANGKWTPGQQLAHAYLTLVPISQALGSKEFIRGKFGVIERPVLGYDEVIRNYLGGLAAGGKAPERFLPEPVTIDEKAGLGEQLAGIVQTIQGQLEGYTEEELDTLVLPHPFLGKLTIRELFFVMAYHATHHLEQVKRNLGS